MFCYWDTQICRGLCVLRKYISGTVLALSTYFGDLSSMIDTWIVRHCCHRVCQRYRLGRWVPSRRLRRGLYLDLPFPTAEGKLWLFIYKVQNPHYQHPAGAAHPADAGSALSTASACHDGRPSGACPGFQPAGGPLSGAVRIVPDRTHALLRSPGGSEAPTSFWPQVCNQLAYSTCFMAGYSFWLPSGSEEW